LLPSVADRCGFIHCPMDRAQFSGAIRRVTSPCRFPTWIPDRLYGAYVPCSHARLSGPSNFRQVRAPCAQDRIALAAANNCFRSQRSPDFDRQRAASTAGCNRLTQNRLHWQSPPDPVECERRRAVNQKHVFTLPFGCAVLRSSKTKLRAYLVRHAPRRLIRGSVDNQIWAECSLARSDSFLSERPRSCSMALRSEAVASRTSSR
jgi:hypothetical protein